MKIAVLDDYQKCAETLVDWGPVKRSAEIVFFHDSVTDEDQLVDRLSDFDILCLNRERTPFSNGVLRRLHKLKHIVLTGRRSSTLDIKGLAALGITIDFTTVGPAVHATPELAIGMMLSLARNIPVGDQSMRAGRWLEDVPFGMVLHGRTLGIIGVGKVGTRVAEIATVLGMRVIAWSPNLDSRRAEAANVEFCRSKQQLLQVADVVSLHMVLAPSTVGMIGQPEFAVMKKSALLINSARGALVDETALVAALQAGEIGGAAIDVYSHEPLPEDHPLRAAPNCILLPHFGYVTEEVYRAFYEGTVEALEKYLSENA